MEDLCKQCKNLYSQQSSNLKDYCIHCKEIVLKSFLDNKK